MTLQVILILIIFILITIIFILFTKRQNKQDNGSMQMLQNQMLHLTKTLDIKLSESSKLMSDNINKTFETSTKINLDATKKIEEITAKLTSLEETNKQIKDI
jgi:predicted Holliday junction resolvase-like endonuclease